MCERIPDLNVVVIDFGAGNMLSLLQALERFGVKVAMAESPRALKNADKIIIPGVGAFPRAMRELHSLGLIEPLRWAASKGTPILGICLGMQLLFSESEEFGVSKGLGIIPGRVVPIPQKTPTGLPIKLPSMGWNNLIPGIGKSWEEPLLKKISNKDSMYFIHSFMAEPENQSSRLADYIYWGHRIAAIVCQEAVVGCQFHPEKSGVAGLKILQTFLES